MHDAACVRLPFLHVRSPPSHPGAEWWYRKRKTDGRDHSLRIAACALLSELVLPCRARSACATYTHTACCVSAAQFMAHKNGWTRCDSLPTAHYVSLLVCMYVYG